MKTVIEMAREAGLFTHKEVQPELERFAELVRADERKKWEDQTAVEIHEAVLDEREACAVMAEKEAQYSLAKAIRSRSSERRSKEQQ